MKFTATVNLAGRTATGIEVPEEVVTALGSGKKPAVKVTLNGLHLPQHDRIAAGPASCSGSAPRSVKRPGSPRATSSRWTSSSTPSRARSTCRRSRAGALDGPARALRRALATAAGCASSPRSRPPRPTRRASGTSRRRSPSSVDIWEAGRGCAAPLLSRSPDSHSRWGWRPRRARNSRRQALATTARTRAVTGSTSRSVRTVLPSPPTN